MTAATDRLWRWAVAVYAHKPVSECCLRLQDEHGHCVPLLLWAAWVGSSQQFAPDATLRQAAAISRAWSDSVVAPLREMRRRLKSSQQAMDDSRRLAIREQIKALELAAERELLAELAALPLEAAVSPAENSVATCLIAAATHWADAVPDFPLTKLAEAIQRLDNSNDKEK